MKKAILISLLVIALSMTVTAQSVNMIQNNAGKMNNNSEPARNISPELYGQKQTRDMNATPVSYSKKQVKATTSVKSYRKNIVRERKRLRIISRNITIDTSLNLTENQNRTKIMTKLSNGKNAEIKIMPEKASKTAIQRLRLKVCSEENNCSIVLKEKGEKNMSRAVYEIKAKRKAKILGIFDAEIPVRAEISAENGKVLKTERPWWAFLAF